MAHLSEANHRTAPPTPPVHNQGLSQSADSERVGRPLDMFFAFGGVNLAVTNLGGGALGIALGLSLRDVLAVYFVGGALGALFIGWCTVQAKRTGTSVMINTRPAFGYLATRPLTVITFLMTACWFGVNNYFGVTSVRSVAVKFGASPNHTTDVVVLLVVMAVIAAIAIYGYRSIIRYQRFAMLAMGLVIVVIAVGAFTSGRIDWNHVGSATGGARLAAVVTLASALGVGWAVSWTPYAYDFGRYLRRGCSERQTFWYAWLGMFLVGACTFSLSAIITSFAGDGFDVGSTVEDVLPSGLAVCVLIVMAVGLVPANLANLLVGPALLETLDLRLNRVVGVVVTAVCGLPIAIVGIFQPSFGGVFENWMLTLGVWLGPWLAIVLVDFFLVHRGHYSRADLLSRTEGAGRLWHLPGIVAWLVGVAAALVFGNVPMFESPLMKDYFSGADASLFIGMVVAAAAYYPWARRGKARRLAERPALQPDDRTVDLTDDSTKPEMP